MQVWSKKAAGLNVLLAVVIGATLLLFAVAVGLPVYAWLVASGVGALWYPLSMRR